jgi:hypothetical protein
MPDADFSWPAINKWAIDGIERERRGSCTPVKETKGQMTYLRNLVEA